MARHLLAVPLATALALGCISATVDHPMQAALQGTWSGCANAGGADREERLTFTGDQLLWTVSTFPTTDASCGGEATPASELSATVVIAEQIKATLDGVEVAAHGLDVTDATRTFYTTIYVDQAGSPRTLYVGEADPSTGRDMTSGAKRPIVLSGEKPLTAE